MAERKMPQNLEAEMMALGCAFLTRYACDKVCEDLKDYQLNVSRLPFNVDTKASVRFTESVQSRKAVTKKGETPDDDSTLENIARMFM